MNFLKRSFVFVGAVAVAVCSSTWVNAQCCNSTPVFSPQVITTSYSPQACYQQPVMSNCGASFSQVQSITPAPIVVAQQSCGIVYQQPQIFTQGTCNMVAYSQPPQLMASPTAYAQPLPHYAYQVPQNYIPNGQSFNQPIIGYGQQAMARQPCGNCQVTPENLAKAEALRKTFALNPNPTEEQRRSNCYQYCDTTYGQDACCLSKCHENCPDQYLTDCACVFIPEWNDCLCELYFAPEEPEPETPPVPDPNSENDSTSVLDGTTPLKQSSDQ